MLVSQLSGHGALIKRLIDYERGRAGDPRLAASGWSGLMFDVGDVLAAELIAAGVLRQVPSTRGPRFLLLDRERLSKSLSRAALDSQPAGELPHRDDDAPSPDLGGDQGVPPDFDDIVGYDDIKTLISESLRLGVRVHYLLLGPPGSAKTLFLLGVERLSGSAYVLGSRMSRSGLSGYLMDARPRILLVDEIDKLPARDLAPLLSLAESGRVVELLNRRRVEVDLDTVVFAAANSVKRIPVELLSRFQVLEFPEYTRDEFIEVCKRVLVRHEGLSVLEAGQVAVRVLDELRSKDVRMAVRVARLARTSLGIDGVIEVFKSYSMGRHRK